MQKELVDIAKNGRYWASLFQRTKYKQVFAEFTERYGQVFYDGVHAEASPAELAEGSVKELDSYLGSLRFWVRSGAVTDCAIVLVAYVFPMLIASGDEKEIEYCRELSLEWNRRHEKNTVTAASYESIHAGFRNTIMGFDIDRMGERD